MLFGCYEISSLHWN